MATPQPQNQIKRVVALYRVSSKIQVDHDDIPMQKSACRDFIDKQEDWALVKEYYEKGVSGFKISEAKRDELQKIKKDAEQGLFDILLVFMMDRLGRKEDESPFVVEFFTKLGIEVWSVKEGQRKIENHTDKLMNYLSFWQSSGESIKTSIRVSESHSQMAKNGIYRGGSAPYGYKLVKSDIINKKGKELLKLEIDEEKSKIVKEIFRLTYEELMGGLRIANHLNEKGIPSSQGKKWTSTVINLIHRNPIYKGYMSYGKNSEKGRVPVEDWIVSQEQNKDLVIVDEKIWDTVFEIKKSRQPQNRKESFDSYRPTKGKLLLVGMIKCGHCGSSLTTTYNYKTWKNKDGTKHSKERILYRCYGKALGKTKCEGQTVYAKNKIEGIVLNEVKTYLDKLKKIDLSKEINQLNNSNTDKNIKKLKELQSKNEDNYKELSALTSEVSKSIMGKSQFKPDLLNSLIEDKEKEIKDLSEKINKTQEDVNYSKIEVDEMQQLQNHIPNWNEVFENANDNVKKKMLSTMIDSVVVYRDKIEIYTNIRIKHFLSNGSLNKVNGSPYTPKLITLKYLEKYIEIKIAV